MSKASIDLGDVAETLLLTLYFRAVESQRPDALVKDEQAVGQRIRGLESGHPPARRMVLLR